MRLRKSKLKLSNCILPLYICPLSGKTPSVRSLSEYSEYPIISKADIDNHNKDDGMWVIIDGKVYNLEKFVAGAPCGVEALRAYAGKPHLGCHVISCLHV